MSGEIGRKEELELGRGREIFCFCDMCRLYGYSVAYYSNCSIANAIMLHIAELCKTSHLCRDGEELPPSQGVLTFDLLSDRPGQSDDGTFTLPLHKFLEAYAVRISMRGYPYVVDMRQKYHSLLEVEVEGL